MTEQRKIIHIDMDAFFASVEQLDNPELRGKPVVVGGDPKGRGVVAACSYEARRFGIASAQSCAKALQRCPGLIFVRPRKDRYHEISRQIMAIFLQYSDLVEPLSIDEAFLDITINKTDNPSATWTAECIRRQIFAETGLTASAGVSYNKFLAKIASDQNKPNGIFTITPENGLSFIHQLPIRKFYGVGKVTEKKMHALGIRTGKDMQRFDLAELTRSFGKAGSYFYDIARGKDNRSVRKSRKRKSIGTETTMSEDIQSMESVHSVLTGLAEKVEHGLQTKNTGCSTITLKVRYADFTTVTRSITPGVPVYTQKDILKLLPNLLRSTRAGREKIRLLGITASNLIDQDLHHPIQLKLPFPEWIKEGLLR